MGTSVFLSVCMYTTCMSGTCGSKKRELDPLELGFHVVLSHQGGTRTQTWVLFKSNKWF